MKRLRTVLGLVGLSLIGGCARPSLFIAPDLSVARPVTVNEEAWVAVPGPTWEHIVTYVTVTDQAMGFVETGLRAVGRVLGVPGASVEPRGEEDPGQRTSDVAGAAASPSGETASEAATPVPATPVAIETTR